jgi:hypothetical protein
MMPFTPISHEELITRFKDDVFWYVVNLSADPPLVIVNPFVDDMDELTYIFREQEDAETFKYVLRRTPAYQDSKLGIDSDKVRNLNDDINEEMGRFKFAGVTHEEAQRMFEKYQDILKTRNLVEDPSLHKPEEK